MLLDTSFFHVGHFNRFKCCVGEARDSAVQAGELKVKFEGGEVTFETFNCV